ncbi:MAG: hypothetical protein IJ031_00055 [Oscillospiraceae bacterium]|nr:hypothetical protein [Oscillospiraceae bacterium]
MIIIKTLKVSHKDLNTSPIRTLMRTGENNADTVVIEMDRFYGGYDLSEFGFIMEGRNASDTLAVSTLSVDILEDILKIYFVVTSDFTAVSGKLKLTLKALNPADNTCIIFTGGEVEVVGNSNEDCLPADIGEQLLLQIEEAIADFKAQISSVAEELVAEEIEKQLPDNYVTSDTVKTLVTLTQEEYDALSAPDDNTMYVII